MTAQNPPIILGVSASSHDAAAALLFGSEVVAALEEEKLARVRRARGLPLRAIRYCLSAARLRPEQIGYIALARPLRGGPGGEQRGESWIPRRLKEEFPAAKIVIFDHHLCHAAAAFYPSPFEEAVVLTLDETGDLQTGSLAVGRGIELSTLEESYFPDSLGNLYSRATALAGFAAGGDEHKLQWLSGWGRPVYAPVFRRILSREAGGLAKLDQRYFHGAREENGGFSEKFFQETELDPSSPLSEEARANLAASVQQAVEEEVLAIGRRAAEAQQLRNLCLGGGLALNSMLVERMEQSGAFAGVFVQPAAGNAGNALGAALGCAHGLLRWSGRRQLEHLFFGPEYGDDAIKDVLDNCKLRYRYLPKRRELLQTAVAALCQDQILGWFQGRAEFGPRALGARSILASPLGRYVNENLNQYVKHREKFRPFAASVIAERAAEFFEFHPSARFLASVGRVKPAHRKTFESNLFPQCPDGESESAAEPTRIRVHVVEKRSHPLFWELLETFGEATGIPVLFNTSFNLFGEPLVCTPRDAVRSFYCSGLDQLVIGHFSVSK
ncbi:MAG TPA: carbamoyltransferase C-terminal domain-containing protein [Terriglobia bacterium]|nr:carbamoyltransferase C-terminal domain-containing protein [Terriglobia bacterium]